MKKTIAYMVVVFFLLGGCSYLFAEDLPSCLDPKSADYNKPVIGGMCDKCGKTFTFSGAQLNSGKMGTCPYCRQSQNLKEACNRYGSAFAPKTGK